MEENDVQEVEAEVAEEELDGFDEAFDDDDFDLSGESEGEEPQEESEGESEDGQPEDDTDAEQNGEAEQEQSEEPGNEAEEGNQLFKIKYLGNEEELTLEQMTELAQKGRNYDHVVEERDRLKGESGRQRDFLQKLADRAGVSIDEQIDLTEAMWLMDEEAEKGNTLTEAEALLRVQRSRNQPSETKTEEAQEPQNNAINMIDRFLAAYPNVKYQDIPVDVWNTAMQTGDLLGAYQAEEIRKLRAENEKVRKEAHNERNSQRSTGPRKSSGSSKPKDDFDAAWDSDD